MDSHRALLDVPRHSLPSAWWSTLSAGGGSPDITRYLWTTERSRRMLLVSTLLGEVERQPSLLGPLPPVDRVWEILAAARAARPSDVDDLLLHPQVGSWAAYALRRHRGGALSALPLWIDFGAVHALALVAAARAGLSWSTQIPVRAGHAMLPTLGMTRSLEPASIPMMAAYTEGGRIWLLDNQRELAVPTGPCDADTSNDTGWWPLRRLRVGDDLPITVWLDDLDPFRDLADPVPPTRLDADAVDRWRALLAEAWALLCRDHRADAEAMAEGVVSLVPMPPAPGWETRSASNGEAFGSVMVSEPPDAVTLAVSLVHEFQHIKLGALLHLVRLTRDDDALYYAPWRDDPRPLPGLLQGVYAFLGIARFWRCHRLAVGGPDAALASFEYAYARAQTAEALQTVLKAPGLTDEGRSFVEGLLACLSGWQDDPPDTEIVRLATLTADSHRTGWRLRHFRPEAGDVAGLAKAWQAHSPVEPAPPALCPHPKLRWSQRLPAVTRRRAYSLGTVPHGSPQADRDSLTTAENALVAGDLDIARTAFLASIEATVGHPDDGTRPDDEVRAWVGLALTVGAMGHTAAAQALSVRPDLVRAVWVELGAMGVQAPPVDIATWLAPAWQSKPDTDEEAAYG